LLRLVGRLLRGKAGLIIRGIIAEGQSDPETIHAFMAGFVTPRRAEVRSILARGVASGELRADLDFEMVLASLFGPLHLRLLLNEHVDDAWIDRLSNFVLAGCMAGADERPCRSRQVLRRTSVERRLSGDGAWSEQSGAATNCEFFCEGESEQG
jgi:Tetracyclin repressor-like, C-terminal domain